MGKYRKKPVVIEAVQFTGTNQQQIIDWANGIISSNPDHYLEPGLLINTLEGQMHGSKNDFIIKGVKNEFYACKPDIFEATYEEV